MEGNAPGAVVLSVGDLILDVPGVDRYFDESRDILKSGDVVIGQVEIPYTTQPFWSTCDNQNKFRRRTK